MAKGGNVRFVQIVLSALLLLPAAAAAFSSSGANGDIHGEITKEALRGTISDANLEFLVKAEDSQDAAGSEGAGDAHRHFSDGNFQAALAYMDREKKKALNYAADADTDAVNRAQCLRHFALALHTAQDFYSHSNYVELQLEDGFKRRDPYSIDVVDWARVPDGYAGKVSGHPLGVIGDKGADISKENATTDEGKKAAGPSTYFKVARDLAVRETQRQWNVFETLVRNRYHTRAEAILTALKTASPAAGGSPDSVPDIE